MKTSALFLAVALAVCTARADKFIPMTFGLAATALVQTNGTTAGGITTIPGPTKELISTTSLLKMLAQAEFNAGNYGTNFFPAGAKLVLMNDADDVAQSYFVVTSGSGQLLVDVSDVLRYEITGNGLITSGKFSDSTGLANPSQQFYHATIAFDDTSLGGVTQFALGGIVQAIGTDTTPNVTTGAYTETWNAKMINGNGEGTVKDAAALYYGTTTASGKQVFSTH